MTDTYITRDDIVIDEEPGSADAFQGEKLRGSADELLPPWPDKPILQISAGNVDALVRQSQEVLSPFIYTRGTELVWIGEATELPPDKIRRPSDQRSIIPVSVAYVIRQISRLATVQRYDGRAKEYRAADWPQWLARSLLDYQNWPQLRPLDAIVRAPFVRADGTVCDEPGYDPQSRCFYDPNAEYPEIPSTVTEDDASDALATLRAPFDQFPWRTPADESAFLAHILTEAARLAVDTAPMFWYTAGNASTGKTLLSEMAALIVHGESPALRPWVSDGAELRKTLFASLLAGDRSIAFDNLPSGYKARAPELCAFLTSAVWKDRKLGESAVRALPNTAVVSASGNNVSAAGDLARRSLVIRLDADTPNLRDRTFKIADLAAYVLAHRVELLMAALTVIRGHQQSGHMGPRPLPSFVQWSHFVRDALLWLGMPDPVDTQAETDEDTCKLTEAFTALAALFKDKNFTPGDVAAQVRSIVDADGKLAAVLHEAGCSDPRDPTRVGYWLREGRDRYGGDWKLEQVPGSATHSKRYRFKRAITTRGAQPIDNLDLVGERP